MWKAYFDYLLLLNQQRMEHMFCLMDYGGGYEKSMHNRIYKIKYAIPQSSQT